MRPGPVPGRHVPGDHGFRGPDPQPRLHPAMREAQPRAKLAAARGHRHDRGVPDHDREGRRPCSARVPVVGVPADNPWVRARGGPLRDDARPDPGPPLIYKMSPVPETDDRRDREIAELKARAPPAARASWFDGFHIIDMDAVRGPRGPQNGPSASTAPRLRRSQSGIELLR
jgi:hypothetical protein